MAYSCYVRFEGRGVVDVQPTVSIRFDQMTAITLNRVRRMFQNNYCSYGWSSKPNAVLVALNGHYDVFRNLLEAKLMSHPDFDREMFAAKALLLGYKFIVYDNMNPKYWRYGYGDLQYTGDKSYDERPVKQMDQLIQDTLLPIAKSLIDHDKLAPIMDALENRQPYTFTGVNMR